jgi:hypothetical protein
MEYESHRVQINLIHLTVPHGQLKTKVTEPYLKDGYKIHQHTTNFHENYIIMRKEVMTFPEGATIG